MGLGSSGNTSGEDGSDIALGICPFGSWLVSAKDSGREGGNFYNGWDDIKEDSLGIRPFGM